MSFRSTNNAIPRPPPTSFTTGGYSDSVNGGSRRQQQPQQGYSDNVVPATTNRYDDDDDDDDDDDMDEELIIDTTTDHVSRIRTATSHSQRSLNLMNSSSNMSVGSNATDPPGSVYGGAEGSITNASSFEYDDTSEADPVIASDMGTRKGRKSGRVGSGEGVFVGNDGMMISNDKSSAKGSCCYRWLCCCCSTTYGKFCCSIVFVILLAIVVTTVGVVMAQRGNSQNSQESAGGTSPSPTPMDPCPTELAAMTQCFGDANKEGACESCVVQYWPATVENCNDIDDETCAAYRECPCDPCINAVDTYVHCLSGCTIECANFNGGTLAPTVTPAPTPPMRCPDEYQAFDACVDPENGGSDCESCVSSNWPPPPAKMSCQEIADYTCPVLHQPDNCGCNNCNDEMLKVLLCLSNCTSLTCGSDGTGSGTRALGGGGPLRQQLASTTTTTTTKTTSVSSRGLYTFADYFSP